MRIRLSARHARVRHTFGDDVICTRATVNV